MPRIRNPYLCRTKLFFQLGRGQEEQGGGCKNPVMNPKRQQSLLGGPAGGLPQVQKENKHIFVAEYEVK